MAGFTYKLQTREQMLTAMRKMGVHNLCVKNFHLDYGSTDAEIAAFVRQCGDFGVKPYGLGPIGTQDVKGDYRPAFELAKKLGANVIVADPWEKADGAKASSRRLCEQASALCDEYDIRFAIHNHGPEHPKCFPTGEFTCEFVKDLSPRMGMCLDIGHDLRGGSDPAETIRKYHKRLFDFHLKDITLVPGQMKAPAQILGRGILDLPGIVNALCEVGYAGVCSIEYETNFTDNFGDLCESVGYFKALVRAMNSEERKVRQ